MDLCCPHCGNEVIDDTAITQIGCASCTSDSGLWDGTPSDLSPANGLPSNGPPAGAQSVGRFVLLEQLGTGAFGTVWRAYDPLLDRHVAVKTARNHDVENPEVSVLLREARSAARLRHPNIVRVHEVGREKDVAYIVSDLVDGVTLADWLTDRPPAPREAAALCVTLAQALHHAHQRGVIHRDLKPSNVMLGRDGEPYLLDFGLAKREADEVSLTRDGQILGTLAYMPPEQARGEGNRADGRADVYSLGVMLFEMLTGHPPFRGTAPMVLHQLLGTQPASPRSINRAVPRDLERICLKCLQKDPGDRYASAQELADDLQRFLAGRPVRARRIGPLSRGWRLLRRHPVRSGMVAAMTIVILLATYSGVQARLRDSSLTTRLVQSELQRDSLWIQRMLTIARSPGYRVAVAEADTLRAGGRIMPGRYYDLACVYAIASSSAARDAASPEAVQRERVGQYRAAALEMLAQADRGGYFDSPDRRRHLGHDPDLQALRGDPAFEQFVESFKEDKE